MYSCVAKMIIIFLIKKKKNKYHALNRKNVTATIIGEHFPSMYIAHYTDGCECAHTHECKAV